jgi:hypothetical protein
MTMKIMKVKVNSKGQALVILLFFMVIAITLTTTSVAVIVANSMNVTRTEESMHALEVAEGGAENALIRLLRDTQYVGETIPLDGGQSVITVTGGTDKTIRSVGSVGSFTRTIEVVVRFTNGVLSVLSWQEI